MARLFTVDKDKWQGYTPALVFKDCWYGYKDIDDEDYNYNVAIIDNEGDIIKMRLQRENEISNKWYDFAQAYRLE